MTAVNRRSFLACGLAAGSAASPAKKYRAAVIGHTGHGNYGHGIDVVWTYFPDIEITAVADADEKGRAAAIKRIRAKHAYADYRHMLRVEKPDLVGVAPRWLDERKDMVTAAAEAGAHIYTEKPFASDLTEADHIVEVVRKNKVKLQVAHQMRVSPFAHRAKAMVEAQEIGEIQEVRARGKEDRRAGGEDMMVLGSHLFDMLRYFLGDPRWVVSHVSTNGEDITAGHVRKATEPVGPVAGTGISAMFAFDGGIHGYFASRASSATDPLRFGIWLYGSKGVLFLPIGIYPAGGLYILRSPGWLPDERTRWERVEVSLDASGQAIASRAGREPANALMVADLLRAIERDARPCCNEDDGRWTIEMVQSVYLAQKSGGRVTFPLRQRTHPLRDL
jgi:predicted dehydrogenase